jgi:hypothetical protein
MKEIWSLNPRSGRKHKAWGGARLCERNPRIELSKGAQAHEMGDSVHCIDGCRPLRGLRHILFVILGLRSQSLSYG